MGFDSLAELEQRHGPLPETYTVLTPSGGEHRYFAYPAKLPEGTVLANSASHVGVDLDIRSDRGQVIAPPSQKAKGCYLREFGSPDEVAEAPAWLIELACTPVPEPRVRDTSPRSDRPGDQWASSVAWSELLKPAGFIHVRTDRTGTDYWRVPNATNPVGATTGFGDTDVLHMFSSSFPPVPAETTVTKFGFLAATRFGGDFSAAAEWCATQGFGVAADVPIEDLIDGAGLITPTSPVDEDTVGDEQSWAEPLTLAPPTPLPEWPDGVFPDWMEQAIDEVAARLRAPRDLAAMTALGAAVTVTTGRIEVDVDGQQVEQANLYLLLVAAPSTGKSPASKLMSAYLDAAHEEYVEWVTPLVAANKADLEDAQDALREARKSGDPTRVEVASVAVAEAKKLPTEPAKLAVSDVTPEALEILVARNFGGVTVADTEGGTFKTMAGRYNDTEVIDVYLKGFSSDDVNTERVSRGPVQIKKATISMVLCVQPQVIREASARPGFTGRGLMARYMYVIPHFTPLWKRDLHRQRQSKDASAVMAKYESEAKEWAVGVLQHPPGHRVRLTLSEAGLARWSGWYHSTARRTRPGGDLEGSEEWLSKANDSVVRLAAILHSLHGYGPDDEISVEIVERAIAVGDYWAAHKVYIDAMWQAPPELQVARSILAWATEQSRAGTTWTVRDFHRTRQHLYSAVDAITPGVELLIERGWIRPVPAPLSPGRGRPTTYYETHPDVRPDDAEPATLAVANSQQFSLLPEPTAVEPAPVRADAAEAADAMWPDHWTGSDDDGGVEENWPDEDPYLARSHH